MSIDELLRAVPPPDFPHENSSFAGWYPVERRLGTTLPNDYKAVIGNYGSGGFEAGSNYVMVLNPFTSRPYFNLIQVYEDHLQGERELLLESPEIRGYAMPFRLHPKPCGLLAWGVGPDFGDHFYWQVAGAPNSWRVLWYNLRDSEYETFPMSLTEFLVSLVNGTASSTALPLFDNARNIRFVQNYVRTDQYS